MRTEETRLKKRGQQLVLVFFKGFFRRLLFTCVFKRFIIDLGLGVGLGMGLELVLGLRGRTSVRVRVGSGA